MWAARGQRIFGNWRQLQLHQSESHYRLSTMEVCLIEARRKQILAFTSYDANEDIMTPNQAGTKADQPAPSSSNVIVTNQSRVACNGVGGPLGHPQVWLTLGTDGKVTCPYCSCAFVEVAK